MRESSWTDYDPDERGRYDGDDGWVERGCCETAEEIGARMKRGWDAYCAQFCKDAPADPTARVCHICRGTGMLPAELGATQDCYHCDGHGRLA